MTAHIPDWKLERYALGELPAEELTAIRQAIANSPEAQARLADLEADNAAILSRYPSAPVARGIEDRLPRSMRTPWRLVLPVLAAAALALVVMPPTDTGTIHWPEVTRDKGLKPRLEVHRQRGDSKEELAAEAIASEGDVLQLSYVAAGRDFGVIFSIDGRGEVTEHFAGPLTPNGNHPLDHAYELDDAPGFERFVLVASETPLEKAAVLERARAMAADLSSAPRAAFEAPEGATWTAILIRKGRDG